MAKYDNISMVWSDFDILFIGTNSSAVLLMSYKAAEAAGNDMVIDDTRLCALSTIHNVTCP